MISVHNADAASGLARDLAFNTKHLGITLADGGPGFETLTEIRLQTFLLLILSGMFMRFEWEKWLLVELCFCWISSPKVGEVLWGFPFVVGGTGQGSSNGDAELGNLSQVESC